MSNSKVGDRLRWMCVYRVVLGMTVSEIAQRMGIAPKSVSKALNTPVGKAERQRLGDVFENVMVNYAVGRLLGKLDTVRTRPRLCKAKK